MTVATLTLGQSKYKLNPKNFPVDAEGKNYKWEVESKGGDRITSLAVNTAGGGSHSIDFESSLTASTVDTASSAFTDGSDKVNFEGSVIGTAILTGNSQSTGGDTVCFFKGVSRTYLQTSDKSDSVGLLRTKGNVTNTALNLGKGQDFVTIAGKTKLGTGVVIDLGKDNAQDVITVADKAVFNNTTIVNFVDGRDRVRVGNTTYNNKTALKQVFGNDIIFTDS